MPRDTESDQLSEWLCRDNYDAIKGYLLGRHGVAVSCRQIESWWWNFLETVESGIVVSLREWLKNRLIDNGLLPAECVGQPEIHLHVVMHCWPWEGPEECGEINWSAESELGLQRPAFFRNFRRMPDGITVAARRLVGEKRESCPYCRAHFRNPNALILHLEQRHPDALTAESTAN